MNRNDKDRLSIRRYLLGYSSGEEREQLEERFITDPEYREEVLVIENELIEDYLANALSDEDRKSFVEHFLSTPQQIQKLKIAEALNQYFSIEAAAHSPPVPLKSRQPAGAKTMRASFLSRNPWAVFALAAAVFLVIFGSVWLFINWRDGSLIVQDEGREFQRELERLNKSEGSDKGTPSTPEPPKFEALTLTLSPVSLRGGGDLPLIALPSRADMAQLLLVLPPTGEYKTYRVVFQKSGDARRFTVNDLAARTTESGRAVILKIPIKYLNRGDYILELSGSNTEGYFEPVGGYKFRVSS